MNTLLKTAYINMMKDHICEVTFEKKDSTIRTMKCTLRQQVINENNLTPTGGGLIGNDQQVRCVDIEKMAWRSFNVDSVLTFHIDLDL